MNLKDQIVIVTGAGSGIGQALARKFSQAGAKVALCGRRREKLEETASACPGPILVVSADVTDPQGRQNLVDRTITAWGRIDLLVNNAGLGSYGSFLDHDESLWRNLLEINLFAPVFLTKAVLPLMLEQDRGLIVNIASIGGLMAHGEKLSPYIASKHALVGFSRALAKDLTGRPVRVLAACPHVTDTELFKATVGSIDELAPVIEGLRDFLDTAEDVAQGIIDQLDSDRVIVFPTIKPEKVYRKQRDV